MEVGELVNKSEDGKSHGIFPLNTGTYHSLVYKKIIGILNSIEKTEYDENYIQRQTVPIEASKIRPRLRLLLLDRQCYLWKIGTATIFLNRRGCGGS
jgi:hypothetical protein